MPRHAAPTETCSCGIYAAPFELGGQGRIVRRARDEDAHARLDARFDELADAGRGATPRWLRDQKNAQA